MKNKYLSLIFVVVGVGAMIFGTFMPWLKAGAYISLLRDLSNNPQTSVSTLENKVRKVFEQTSPVGQEEVVKFMSSEFSSFVNQQSEPVAKELTKFISPYFLENNIIQQITKGGLYGLLWERFHNEEDYQASMEAFRRAENIGPHVPIPLYNQLNLALEKGDKNYAKEIGEKILSLWPEDQGTRARINN